LSVVVIRWVFLTEISLAVGVTQPPVETSYFHWRLR
jgi:hypothetical protein